MLDQGPRIHPHTGCHLIFTRDERRFKEESFDSRMHELSIAQNVLDIVHQYVPAEDRHRIATVGMNVGELSGVVVDSLEFCFTAITSDTPMREARLKVVEIPLQARCRSCAAAFRVEHSQFSCPSCGSTDLEITAGRELQVTDIELRDGEEGS